MQPDEDFPDDPLLLQQKFKDKSWGGRQIRGISLFEYLTQAELEDLYQIGKILLFNPKANIIIEAEPTRGLFVLLQGFVSVYKREPTTGNLIRLAFLEHGSAFGEISLFDDAPRSATVTAEAQCSLFYLDQAIFDEYLKQKGDNIKSRFYQKCAEDMGARFRRQNSDYVISQNLLWKYALRKEEKKDHNKAIEVQGGSATPSATEK